MCFITGLKLVFDDFVFDDLVFDDPTLNDILIFPQSKGEENSK